MKNIVICLIFLSTLCVAQTVTLTPTDLENAKLAKLKAQKDTIQSQIQQIDIQIQGLNALKQLLNEHEQQKYSEFLGEAQKVKEAHKDWGEPSKVSFNENLGESGGFSKETPKKEEIPNPQVKVPQGQKK